MLIRKQKKHCHLLHARHIFTAIVQSFYISKAGFVFKKKKFLSQQVSFPLEVYTGDDLQDEALMRTQ